MQPITENVNRQLGLSSQNPPSQTHAHQQQNYFARNHKIRGLPSPPELASRIEEARTSAKLLLQVVQSTPSREILNNELIAEFAQRCQSASRSIQGYINCDDPAPDDETLLTMIETNEQLSTAMSKHQRAVLTARKALAARDGAGGGYRMTPSPGTGNGVIAAAAPDNPFGDDHRSTQPASNSGYGASYTDAPTNGAGAHLQPTPSNSLFGPPSQPRDQPAPQDESFRLTLPHQPRESSPPAPPAPADPRWSWSQRMSTQTGYGPPGSGGAGEQGSRTGSVSQMGGQPGYQPPPSPAQVYRRQQSAIDHTTMRGAAPVGPSGLRAESHEPSGGESSVGEAETVSPVSPLDGRHQQGGGMARM